MEQLNQSKDYVFIHIFSKALKTFTFHFLLKSIFFSTLSLAFIPVSYIITLAHDKFNEIKDEKKIL
jgi:hypothetical protein